jgi:hypothetical protein
MTSTRWWRSSVPNAGKPSAPKGAVSGKSAGDLYDGYMMAEPVARGVRIDLYDYELAVNAPLNNRFCKIMDLRTARSLAILLIDAIAKAELEEARTDKKRKK